MTETNEKYATDIEKSVENGIDASMIEAIAKEVYIIAQGVKEGLERAGFEMPLYNRDALNLANTFMIVHGIDRGEQADEE